MRMDVWLEAHTMRVGLLERADDKTLSFTYEPDATEAARISLSMPVRTEPYTAAACRGYFENLLFEGPQLDRVLDSHNLDRGDTGALLYHLGADCPGALSITPEGSGPAKRPGIFPDDYDRLSEDQLHTIVHSLHLHRRLPDENRDPSPLAGVQGKIAIVFRDGEYFLPKGGTRAPTTHILKVSPQTDSNLTRFEVTLLSMAAAAGLRTTGFQEKVFDVAGLTINAILVERFDRDTVEDRIYRIHAEDFCQALGLPPLLKYERNSLSQSRRFSATAVGTIAAKASAPGLFMEAFLDQTLFNLMVGNTDNHGKNSSILHRNLGSELAPLYDVVPVFMDATVTHQFAFDIGNAQFAEDLVPDDLLALMKALGYSRPRLDRRLLGKLHAFVWTIADRTETSGGKQLADALAEQLSVVTTALRISYEVPVRDYFGRITRDDKKIQTGWAVIS